MFILMTGVWFGLQVLTVAPHSLLIVQLEQPGRSVTLALLMANVVLCPCYLLAGALGQRRGRRPVLMYAGLLSATVAAAAFAGMVYVLRSGGSLGAAIALYTVALCLTVAPNAIMIPYICERFATGVRASGYGVGYSLAILIPAFYSFYLLGLAEFMPYEYGPVVMIVIGGVLMFLGARMGPETREVGLKTAA